MLVEFYFKPLFSFHIISYISFCYEGSYLMELTVFFFSFIPLNLVFRGFCSLIYYLFIFIFCFGILYKTLEIILILMNLYIYLIFFGSDQNKKKFAKQFLDVIFAYSFVSNFFCMCILFFHINLLIFI